MHKKTTNLKHSKIANDLMSYIYDNIQSDINLDQISYDLKISKSHLHKIFKEQMDTTIYESIKSIRLQKAANILISNKQSTITEISNMCGYSSQTSFIRAFKQRFEQTPKYWRKYGHKEYSQKILNTSSTTNTNLDFNVLEQSLIKVKPRMAYYIRQKGYKANYKKIWEKMTAWIYSNNIKEYEQIGIFHDNPSITKLEDCNYVACVVPKNYENLQYTNLPKFEIQECLCITFKIKSKQKDILNLIQWVYHHWLPNSGYESITIPSYMIFEENFYENSEGSFKGTYHVPVKYI